LLPEDLLDTALRLAQGTADRPPTQADLRRAASSVYYAVFHAICQSNADTLAGDDPQNRDQEAWHQAYRALEHGYANRRCRQVPVTRRFSQPIQGLAAGFPILQILRHQADYDPDRSVTQAEVSSAIELATGIIADFRNAPARERRAFAVFVLMRERQE